MSRNIPVSKSLEYIINKPINTNINPMWYLLILVSIIPNSQVFNKFAFNYFVVHSVNVGSTLVTAAELKPFERDVLKPKFCYNKYVKYQ